MSEHVKIYKIKPCRRKLKLKTAKPFAIGNKVNGFLGM